MPETVGQQLQNARQTRGIQVEEAARATCIRVWYLRALEADDRASLPSGVQGKGFLRNYAAYLGLPVQPLLDQWEGKLAAAEPPPAALVIPAPPAVKTETGTTSVEPSGETEEALPAPAVEPPSPPAPSHTTPASSAPSQAIFIEIGQKLREQRELLSLSLTEVERYTHLRVHYLKAMESGQMDELPSMVQGRGMLSNYASFLNLDGNVLLNRFADALQTRREETAVVQPSRRPPLQAPAHPAVKRLLSMDLLVGGGMIIFLVGFVIWGASQVMAAQNQAKATQLTVPVIAAVDDTPDLAALTPAPDGSPAAAAATADINATIAIDPELMAPTGEFEATGTAQNGPPQMVAGKVQIYVVAQQRAWMKVTVDGRDEFVGRAVSGAPYTFTGDQTIELVTGNAAALQVYYNETNLGSLGNASEVVRLVFTVDQGVQTPTPTVTPTPTQTPKVSPTPTATATIRPELPYLPTVP